MFFFCSASFFKFKLMELFSRSNLTDLTALILCLSAALFKVNQNK